MMDTMRRSFLGRLFAGGAALTLYNGGPAPAAPATDRSVEVALTAFHLAVEDLSAAAEDLKAPHPFEVRRLDRGDDDNWTTENNLKLDVDACLTTMGVFSGLLTAETGIHVNPALALELRRRQPVRVPSQHRRLSCPELEQRYWHIQLATYWQEQTLHYLEDGESPLQQTICFCMTWAIGCIESGIVPSHTLGTEALEAFLDRYVDADE